MSTTTSPSSPNPTDTGNSSIPGLGISKREAEILLAVILVIFPICLFTFILWVCLTSLSFPGDRVSVIEERPNSQDTGEPPMIPSPRVAALDTSGDAPADPRHTLQEYRSEAAARVGDWQRRTYPPAPTHFYDTPPPHRDPTPQPHGYLASDADTDEFIQMARRDRDRHNESEYYSQEVEWCNALPNWESMIRRRRQVGETRRI